MSTFPATISGLLRKCGALFNTTRPGLMYSLSILGHTMAGTRLGLKAAWRKQRQPSYCLADLDRVATSETIEL